ncbi:MAG: glycosyltransferase family 2 protein [Saprospiraceae bacterium]|nr:glycosyltransferase family 2 protein [Saprospiraceae bacterium]
MKNPLISILIPVKNSAPFLKECIDSILIQSYSNWQLITVDDHSTDSSYKLLEEYASNDKRIIVLKNNGNGIIDALRTAFKLAIGELITRMDSDDIMARDKLLTLCNNLLQSGKGHIATGLVKYFCADTLGNGYKEYEKWLNKLTTNGDNFSEIYKECVIPSPCWMVYRSDLDKCKAFSSHRYPEDYDLCFRFYQNNLKCIPCNELIHYWRDSRSRASRNDPNYSDNNFLDLKLHYFLKLSYNKDHSLILWGAGKKGKKTAKILIQKSIPFYWICNNKNKVGKTIYTKKILDIDDLNRIKDPQIIITVAQIGAQCDIINELKKKQLKNMKDYFFFC